MNRPHLVCVLAGSGDPIFTVHGLDHKMAKDDEFRHTVGGVTTTYKVETAILDVESMTGNPEITSKWTTLVLRVTASVVP